MAQTSFPSVEAFRRRHVPDPLADVRADVVESMGRAESPTERQAIYDAAMTVVAEITGGGADYDQFIEWAHGTFVAPDESAQLIEAHRDAALERMPELGEVFDALAAAGSDEERAEIVYAAVASGHFDADDDATAALLLSDPTVDGRLAAEADQRAAEFTDPARRHARAAAEVAASIGDVTETPSSLRAALDQFLAAPAGDEQTWLAPPGGTDG